MSDSHASVSSISEISSLQAQLDEIAQRVTTMAEAYAGSPDSQIAADLFATERLLHATRRSLERARQHL